jgi:hypothetical protein
VEDELGVTVRLRPALEHEIAGGLEGGTVEARRHRPVGRIAAFCRSTIAAIRFIVSIT